MSNGKPRGKPTNTDVIFVFFRKQENRNILFAKELRGNNFEKVY